MLHIFSLLLPVQFTLITLQPCALNAQFQHFILRFNKISLLLRIPLKGGIGVTAQRIGGETDNFAVYNEFRLLLAYFVPFSAMMQLVHHR
jgi:hypothetical protein